MFLLFLLFPLILFEIFYHTWWKRRNLPPGPAPLPIFGNVRQMVGPNRYKAFQNWAAKYGPVYTIWLSEHPIVIVTDFELIKGAFIKDADSYVDRDFLNTHFRIIFGSVDGIIRSEGEEWRQMRKFLFKSMRDYENPSDADLAGQSIENQVLDAIFGVIEEVRAELAAGFVEHSVDRKVDMMTCSVINQILLGYGFHGDRYNDFVFLKKQLDVQQEYFASLSSLLIEKSPWLHHLPYFSTRFEAAKDSILELFNFGQREIEQRVELRKQADYAPEMRDLLDQFLDQIKRTDQAREDNFFKLKYLPAFIYDIFLAGQETTSNTLNFLILYLMLDQDAQEKLHAELDFAMVEKRKEAVNEEVCPRFRQSDRPKLHFTNAVVHETQRLCNLLPLNLTRCVNRDVKIGGHRLCKSTTVVPQISCVLYDEKIFPDPQKFMPERFLDGNGQFKKIEEFIPFGVGKRICPGEALGRMELFLFTANFFHKFHVYPPNPLDPPKHEKRQTFAVKLPEYKCRVEMRNS